MERAAGPDVTPGSARDPRAGAHHGAFCRGRCWSLMALLAAFGMMNLWAMVGLTAVLTTEKPAPAGLRSARVVGMTSVALAMVVVWVPELAPALVGNRTSAGDPAPRPDRRVEAGHRELRAAGWAGMRNESPPHPCRTQRIAHRRATAPSCPARGPDRTV
ncbi:copper chaperone [Streptomyces sp. NPDC003758]